MALEIRREAERATEPDVTMRVVESPEAAAGCGECRFHMPHATRPDGWCACDGAELHWQQVASGRAACKDFAGWPEGSPVAAFLAAMRF
jgi:hypothetical protein